MNKKNIRKSYLGIVGALVALGYSGTAAAQACQDLRDLGDVLTFAVPLGGVALTTAKWDGEGAWQMFKTYAYAGAWTGTFKQIGQKSRPDAGTSTQSFTSGHSTGAFMGSRLHLHALWQGLGYPCVHPRGRHGLQPRVCAEALC